MTPVSDTRMSTEGNMYRCFCRSMTVIWVLKKPCILQDCVLKNNKAYGEKILGQTTSKPM